MPEKIIMPRMGMTMETGIITKWYKKEGEPVKKGEPVAEIMTDKANMDIEAQSDGYLYKRLSEEGDEVPVGTIIGIIKNENDTDEEMELITQKLNEAESVKEETENILRKEEKKSQTLPVSETGEIRATPYAKHLAKIHNIDIERLSGPGSILTSKEVLSTTKSSEFVRVAMAHRMVESAKIPQFTLFYNFNASTLLKVLNDVKATFPGITLTVLLLKIVSQTIEKHPIFNSVYIDGNMKTNQHRNIGVAIATEKGLFVPVIKQVENKTLNELVNELSEMKKRVNQGRLRPEDTEGASITISNMGMLGVEMFRALLIPGQSAILAISAIKDGIVIKNGGVFVEKIFNVSISCDHRFIDGAAAAKFMKDMKEITEKGIEQWG